jgi:hypothetical protein
LRATEKSEGTRNAKKIGRAAVGGRRWLKKVVRELGERVMAQAKYDEFKALPLIVLARLK